MTSDDGSAVTLLAVLTECKVWTASRHEEGYGFPSEDMLGVFSSLDLAKKACLDYAEITTDHLNWRDKFAHTAEHDWWVSDTYRDPHRPSDEYRFEIHSHIVDDYFNRR